MRCSCPECDTYMVHSEGLQLGCVCPECGARCKACLGTNTVISRDTLRSLKKVDWFTPDFNSPTVSEEKEAEAEIRKPTVEERENDERPANKW